MRKTGVVKSHKTGSTGTRSYKITGSGVAVVSSGNFVRSEKVQSGVSKFRELRKQSSRKP
jgi:hypothetical protein